MATYENIKFGIENGLATIVFNRPQTLNALSSGLKKDLLSVLREIRNTSSGARALLLTGEGRAFCAGADLTEGDMGGPERDLGQSLMDDYHPILLELASLKIPVISAVNGVAAGAGMSIAISADIVIAAKSAYFLQAFVNIGLVSDAGSTFLLPRLVGAARARAMMMLGEKLPAETAKEWGLIYEVVDDEGLTVRAKELGEKLASGPTAALNGIRQLVNQSLKNNYAEQLQAEAITQREMGSTHDCAEGVMAFIQKREAIFKGK